MSSSVARLAPTKKKPSIALKRCTQCFSAIPKVAVVCRFCTRRVEGKSCPQCLDLAPEEAKTCGTCGNQFAAVSAARQFRPFTVKANSSATLLLRFRMVPDRIVVSSEKLVLTTYGLFRMSQHDEEIPWEKVAGFDYRSGIFWDMISIETRGQKSTQLACLTKKDGERIRDVLQSMKE